MLTGLLYTSFPLGGAMGAFAAAKLLPLFGWPAIFYLGGAIPLLLAVVVAVILPEPLRFLLLRPDGQQVVHRIVRQFAPDMPLDGPTYVDTEVHARGLPIRYLFSRGRVASTLLLWVSFFVCFLLLIVFTLWVPALMRESGLDEENATLMVGMITLGGVVGTGIGGRLVDRFNPFVALSVLFIVGAASLVLFGHATESVTLLALFAALFGCVFGAASSGLLGVAILIYPSAIRATGLGWAMALGRMGQVIGPLVVGALLKGGLAPREIFLLSAAPAVLAAIASTMLGRCLPANHLTSLVSNTSE
jgi:MFS transporter, AAHS family, 4-hydroxybenzoate transporter